MKHVQMIKIVLNLQLEEIMVQAKDFAICIKVHVLLTLTLILTCTFLTK